MLISLFMAHLQPSDHVTSGIAYSDATLKKTIR